MSKPLNQLSALGTLHDVFLSNRSYGLKEFASALFQFRPEIIFSEVRAEFPGVENGCIDGGLELCLVYAYAERGGIPVIPTDWFDDSFIRQMIQEGSSLSPEAGEKLGAMMEEYQASFFSSSLLGLHSPAAQAKIRSIYEAFEAHGLMASRERNERILSNMREALTRLEGKRILAVYGMDHKYFIDDHLRGEVEAIPVSDWFDPAKAEEFLIPASVKSAAIRNLELSRKALVLRLQAGNYSPELADRMRAKLPRFESWVSYLKEMQEC